MVMTRRIPLPQANGQVEDTGPAGNAPRSLIDETDREILRVLQVDGRTSNTEIARRLGLGEGTVKTHVGHVFAKLDLRDRAAAVVPRGPTHQPSRRRPTGRAPR